MAKKFKLLRASMTPLACNESRDLIFRLLNEMSQHELHRARGVPHEEAIGDPECDTVKNVTHEA